MIHYFQQDPRWNDTRLGHGYEGVTIGNFGSFLVCLADVISNYGWVITPEELNHKLKDVSGFSSGLIKPYSIEEAFPVKVRVLVPLNFIRKTSQIVNEQLEAGRLVIAQIDESWLHGYQGLWVVFYKKEEKYLVLDPMKKEIGRFSVEELYPHAGSSLEECIFQLVIIEPDNFIVEVDPVKFLGENLEEKPWL